MGAQPINVKNIVIVGGGTAGWMTASAVSKVLAAHNFNITLIESEEIGTVGVGEATVPHIRYFNDLLGIAEDDFIRRTGATYKLGIEFIDWGRIGDRYIHPFGVYGRPINNVGFLHSWLRARELGDDVSIEDYALGSVAARKERFAHPSQGSNDLASKFSYAFHLDANRYAQLLKEFSLDRGVKRIEGKVEHVALNKDNGSICSVALQTGEVIEGDLFIDCSGFRALLSKGALNVGFEDWSHWLPCNRAVAIPSERKEGPKPYSQAYAQRAGWRWHIPLQHRSGNGYVYCNGYITDEEAHDTLMSSLGGKPLADPNFLKFQTGVRKQGWYKNCVAIGLSAGFLEPLESTSIYLIQMAAINLLNAFSSDGVHSESIDEYNRLMQMEYRRVRDFLILHYSATQRDDSEFWNYCRTMQKPATLQRKIDLFCEQGQVEDYKKGMFLEPSWIAVYIGQNIVPQRWHGNADSAAPEELLSRLGALRKEVSDLAESMPSHSEAISRYTDINNLDNDWPPSAMNLYGVFS